VEGRLKVLEEEMAQARVNLEQQRTDNDEMKKNLETKDDKLKEIKKENDNTHKSANSCKTELVCARFHIGIGYEKNKILWSQSHKSKKVRSQGT
jgi:hypothetical protein